MPCGVVVPRLVGDQEVQGSILGDSFLFSSPLMPSELTPHHPARAFTYLKIDLTVSAAEKISEPERGRRTRKAKSCRTCAHGIVEYIFGLGDIGPSIRGFIIFSILDGRVQTSQSAV